MAGEPTPVSPSLNPSGPPPLACLRQIRLLKTLAREAGWQHLAGLNSLSSLLEIPGLDLAVTLLLAWPHDKPLEVLDEPTAFLDAKAAEQARSVMRERAEQRLRLISSHEPELLAQADRVIVLPTPSASPEPMAAKQKF